VSFRGFAAAYLLDQASALRRDLTAPSRSISYRQYSRFFVLIQPR
jgi:hypothetical protein